MMICLFVGIALVTLCWTIYYKRNWSKAISISLEFEQKAVYEGEQVSMLESITNEKRLPVPILETTIQMNKELIFEDMKNARISDFTNKRDVFSMLGYQKITRRLFVDCTKRGYYEINQLYCNTRSLLYTKSYSEQKEVKASLFVYPKRVDVSDIDVKCEKIAGNLQCEKRLYEDPFAFCAIREYRITDSMKAINWKASAKTGDLMVNTFESTLAPKVMIYLDLQDRSIMPEDDLNEMGISVAATLAQRLIRNGMEVGIGVSGEEKNERLEPASGSIQLERIEKMLSIVKQGEKVKDFVAILRDLPKDAVPVFISKNIQNQEEIERFLGRRQEGIWVIPCWNKIQKLEHSQNLHIITKFVKK